MSGNKTRFGFAGSSEPAPEGDSAQAARTLIGHDIHLPQFPAGGTLSPAPPPPTIVKPERPAPAMPATVFAPPAPPINESIHIAEPLNEPTKRLPVAITEEMARAEASPTAPHSGKSNFPTIAKVFGRWTTGGGFRRQSQLDVDDDDPLVPPKDPMIRNVLLLVVVAVLSFSLVMVVLRLPGCQDDYAKLSIPPAPAAAPPPPALPSRAEAPPPPPRPAPTPTPSSADIASVKASLRPPAPVVAPKPAESIKEKKAQSSSPPRQPATKSRPLREDNPDNLMPMRM